MQLPPIGAHTARAEGVVIGGQALHRLDRREARRLGLHRADRGRRLQVVQHHGVALEGNAIGEVVVHHLRPEPRGQRAGAVVEVPVGAFRKGQALGGGQAYSVHVDNKGDHRRYLDPPPTEAEFLTLLHAVDHVRARVAERDNIGPRRGGGDKEGGEIRGLREGIDRGSHHLPTLGFNNARDLTLYAMAEGVIGGDAVPALGACLRQRAAG